MFTSQWYTALTRKNLLIGSPVGEHGVSPCAGVWQCCFSQGPELLPAEAAKSQAKHHGSGVSAQFWSEE